MIPGQPQEKGGLVEWALSVLLAVNLIWNTLQLGGVRPETQLIGWLLTGGTWTLQLLNGALSKERIHPASWYPLPFLLYGLANVIWITPVPWLGWMDWLEWLQMAVVFWILLNGIRHRGPRLLLLGTITFLGVAAVLLASYQRFLWPDFLVMGRKQVSQFFGRSSGPFGIPNSLGAFLILLIPVSAALVWQRGAGAIQRLMAGYCFAIFLLGLGLSISRGAWISVTVAFVFWPLCIRERSWEWRVGVSVATFTLALLAAGAVYLTVPQVKNRFDQLIADAGERSRPILWRASVELFADSSVVGTGAGSYNTLFERKRPLHFHDEPLWAHNDYLNTLSDYGAMGFLLCFGGIGGLIYGAAFRTRRVTLERVYYRWSDSPDVTRALAIGLLAFGFSLFVDFHLKIPALGMAVAVIGGECVLRSWPTPAAGSLSNVRALGLIGGALASIFVTLALAVPLYRGEALRYDAREEIDRMARKPNLTVAEQRDVLAQADSGLEEASLLDPSNGQTWADRSYVSALWTRLAPLRSLELGKIADQEARAALARSSVVPEFWVRLGVALDLQGKWVEATPAFGRGVELSPNNAKFWYYEAYHFSLKKATHTLAEGATRQALELNPYFEPAIILQKSLISSH